MRTFGAMSQAQRIISKFAVLSPIPSKGIRPLARLLNHRNSSTVQRWWQGGFIPRKHEPDILAVARQNGIALGSADFVTEPAGEGAR